MYWIQAHTSNARYGSHRFWPRSACPLPGTAADASGAHQRGRGTGGSGDVSRTETSAPGGITNDVESMPPASVCCACAERTTATTSTASATARMSEQIAERYVGGPLASVRRKPFEDRGNVHSQIAGGEAKSHRWSGRLVVRRVEHISAAKVRT